VTLATDILALNQAAFSAAFRKSPMKRAWLAGLRRNAAVVFGTVGTTDDVLTRAQQDDDTLVPEHARGALARRRCTDVRDAARPPYPHRHTQRTRNKGSESLNAEEIMDSDPMVAH